MLTVRLPKEPTVDFNQIRDDLIKSDEYLCSGNLQDYVLTKYQNCEEFVREWIIEDLQNKKKNVYSKHEEIIKLKELHDDLKYEIIQFIPTCSSTFKDETSPLFDTQLITLHKMRLISKKFNSIMIHRILTLSHMEIDLSHPLTKSHFYNLLNAQAEYKLEQNNFKSQELLLIKNQLEQETNRTMGLGFQSPLSFENYPALPFTREELKEYKKALCQTFKKPINNNNRVERYKIKNVNTTIESLVVEISMNQLSSIELHGDEFSSIADNCKHLKKLYVVSDRFSVPDDWTVFESLEEIHFCSSVSVLDLNSENVKSFLNFLFSECPKLHSITFSPFIQNYPISKLEKYLNPQRWHNRSFKKMNIFIKEENGENTLVKSFDSPSEYLKKEVSIFLSSKSSHLSKNVFRELEKIYGNSFIRKQFPGMLFSSFLDPSSFEELRKFRDLCDYAFKERCIPIQYLDLLNFCTTCFIQPFMIQYICYLCNEYQESRLFVIELMQDTHMNTFSHALRFINFGWDFRKPKALNNLVQLFTNVDTIIPILDNFPINDETLLGLLRKFIISSFGSVYQHEHQDQINLFICHLLSHNPRRLCEYLVEERIHFTLLSKPCSIPLLAALFYTRTSHFLYAIIKEMDQDIFDRLGVNERGDSILHLLLYLRDDSFSLDYSLLCEIVKKNSNLLNLENAKSQTPLQIMTKTEQTAKLVLKELKRTIKDVKF